MEIPIIGDHPSIPYRNKLLYQRYEEYEKEEDEYEYIQQPFLNRPSGFEYTLGDGWLTVPGYKNVEGYYLYSLGFKDNDFIDIKHVPNIDKILTINSLEELLHFELLFKWSSFGEIKIEWPSVAARYGGIEFSYNCFNDKVQPRSTWYNDLQTTRGFIWSRDILSRVVLNKALDGEDLVKYYKEHGGGKDREYNKLFDKPTPRENTIEARLSPFSDLPLYINEKRSKLSESTKGERIMVLTTDGTPVKIENDVVYALFQFDQDTQYATYESYNGDISMLVPKEGYLLKKIDIEKRYYTDIRHADRDKILRIGTYGDLLQLSIGYSNLLYGDKYYIYDKLIIDFETLAHDFGGIEIDIYRSELNFNGNLRNIMDTLRVRPGGIIWNQDLITKFAS